MKKISIKYFPRMHTDIKAYSKHKKTEHVFAPIFSVAKYAKEPIFKNTELECEVDIEIANTTLICKCDTPSHSEARTEWRTRFTYPRYKILIEETCT